VPARASTRAADPTPDGPQPSVPAPGTADAGLPVNTDSDPDSFAMTRGKGSDQ
jgi:hypothetical protein